MAKPGIHRPNGKYRNERNQRGIEERFTLRMPAGALLPNNAGIPSLSPSRKLRDAMFRAHRGNIVVRWLSVVLIVCLTVSGTIVPRFAPAARAQAGGDDVDHPRRAMTERAFHRLKDVLSPHHPTVHPATLHFVDAAIANAWVNQAAEVYVATGLLDLLETEEQIAGVLAHELAHVTQQHVPKQIRRYWGLTLLVIAANIAVDRTEREQRQRFSMVHPLLMNAYSREAELEADRVALRYLEMAGYHPKGLLEALERLQMVASRQPVEELWMTHPLPELRLGVLRRYIDPRMGIPVATRPASRRGCAPSLKTQMKPRPPSYTRRGTIRKVCGSGPGPLPFLMSCSPEQPPGCTRRRGPRTSRLRAGRRHGAGRAQSPHVHDGQ